VKRYALPVFLALTALLGAGGCANVTSAMGGNVHATGEAWYVKTTTLFALPVKSHIYYCPPSTTAAVECTQAVVRR
jgi:hypothetical protein